MMKRTFAAPALACALALVAVACGDDDGDDANGDGESVAADTDGGSDTTAGSGSLIVYTSGPGGLKERLAADFEERTGIRVELFQGDTGDVLGRLEAEAGNPVADVVILASWVPAVRYRDEGLIMPYEAENADRLYDGWYDPDHHFYGFSGSALVLSVNPEEAPSTPSDWFDLTGDEWDGSVIMPDPRESGTARDLVGAMVAQYGDDAWELFDGLAANGLAVEGANRPSLDSVVTGVHAAVVGGVDYMAYGDIEAGEALEVVLPDSGTMVTPRPVFILDSTDNPDEAKQFVDYLLSDDAQQLVADAFLIPGRADFEYDTHPALDEVPLLEFDWDFLEDNGEDILAEFVERYL